MQTDMTHECVSLCMHWQTVMSVTINHTFGASCQLTDLMHDMQRYCANVKCLKQFSKSVLRPVMWFCGYARTAVHLNTMFTRTQIIVEFVWWLKSLHVIFMHLNSFKWAQSEWNFDPIGRDGVVLKYFDLQKKRKKIKLESKYFLKG